MRKRNILKTADTIFWYFLYLLPLVGYLTYLFAFGQNPGFNSSDTGVNVLVVSIQSFLSYTGLIPSSSNVIYNTLNSIFGIGGMLPFVSNTVILILTYYVSLFIMHFIVDVLLFIPRFAMKWMDEFTKE